MDENGNDCSCGTYMPVDGQKIEKVELKEDREVDDESAAALLLPRKGGMSRTLEKPRRKVQWNDSRLAEVLEYQPSEVHNEESDICSSCIIM